MRTFLLPFAVVAFLVVPSHVVHASPGQASGTFQVTGFALTAPPQQHGDTCFIEATVTFAFDGTLVGSFAANITIRRAGDCGQPGPETFRAAGTFAGTVGGAAGTFDFDFQAILILPAAPEVS